MKHVSMSRWFVIITLTLLCVISAITGVGLILTSHGTATAADLARQGRHRDCVTTIATARNAVFQNVDIYKAIQIDQTDSLLLQIQGGEKATPEQLAAFTENRTKLHAALDEARRLQPAGTLDRLIDHGGMVDGKHYDACPS